LIIRIESRVSQLTVISRDVAIDQPAHNVSSPKIQGI
jgi:hypothetical protein